MSSNKKIAEFPNVEAKLQKPTKQSAFERKKAEAEAKRQREAAEAAAVYEDFIKSFDHDADADGGGPDARPSESRYGGRNGPPERQGAGFAPQTPFGGGAGKRHFGMPAGSVMKSGPGSLGPPPSSLGKKRFYDGTPTGHGRDRDDSTRRFGFEDQGSVYKSIPKAFDASDDEEAESTTLDRAEEKAISRPTLRLANLPPATSPAVVRALIPPNLTVENVKIVPPSGPSGTERKSTAAIVTLSKETPATDIDAAVSSLQNHYLGFGFYLSLHRHLSSAAISSTSLSSSMPSAAVSQPFGAKRVTAPARNQGPPSTGFGRGGFAPPPSYGPPAGGPGGRSGILHVPIQPPKNIKQIRMIHKVIEAVLEHGPEFEALLMSRPDVQREEKWAWVWDARSEGGIWYRWRLWEIVTGMQTKRGQGKYLPLFEGSHAWKVPDQPLSYEYTTRVDEFLSDSEYNSSDDDDFEDEQGRQAEGTSGAQDQEDMFLNPIEQSRMAHLLARLPTTLSKLRKGDIARVTAFAITHASKGSDEIAEMIVSNINRPFAFTSANPDYKQESKGKADRDSREGSPTQEDKAAQDTSGARLVGLYVVSDVLSSSSTSGIRHTWRYRQLLENALRNHKTFETLGMLAEKYSWGRLRAEKWKRSVGLVLSLWEGWCVFPVETQEFFVNSFENPPQLKKEDKADEAQKKAGRWKTVEASAGEKMTESRFLPVSRKPPSRQGSPVATGDTDRLLEMLETGDTDGEVNYSYGASSDVDSDGDPLSDCDIDGAPIGGCVEGPVGGDDTREGMLAAAPPAPSATLTGNAKAVEEFRIGSSKAAPSRKRMRAVDMFAYSGSEEEGD